MDKDLEYEIKYWYENTGSPTAEEIVRRAYSLGLSCRNSYLETYYEVVSAFHTNSNSRVLEEIENTEGRGGMYDFAKKLTDEFELLNKGRVWDGEFFDEIDKFLESKL